jgi:phthiocerol/phenolphthiocerol synthesis type-I polyketide synthase E
MSPAEADADGGRVAIIGMSGRFPGASNVEAFWRNVRDGVESITFFTPEELRAAGVPEALMARPGYVPARAVLADVELFDARLFGYSAREAEVIDPQQRLFLECAWEAIEQAGYDPARCGGRIGAYAGSSISTYVLNLYTNRRLQEAVGLHQLLLGNDKDHLTLRAAHKLNLRGPCVTVQTTCSTSLVAVHLACQSLLTYQCDMALAGGVTVAVPQTSGYLHLREGIYSPDGRCRAFDARAAGTVGGNGAGAVLLKRLADAIADRDTIHAVILGSAINNDGALKVGYTAPSVDGQVDVIAEALAAAEVSADTISYVETHGTATGLGDPIEVAALQQAFGGAVTPAGCAIGSVKTNVGHLDAAAGVAGLIKTVMALRERILPPSLHFETPNPRIDFGRFRVNTCPTPWETGGGPRRAGVSAFGIGGTNAHVVLEEAPPAPLAAPGRPRQLLVLSAPTPTALEAMATNLATHIEDHAGADLADVAHTLQVGRRLFSHRLAVVCGTDGEAVAGLRSRDPRRVVDAVQDGSDRPVAFLFPGQGSQRVGMGEPLYLGEPVFRDVVDDCAGRLSPHLGADLRDALYPAHAAPAEAEARLRQTAMAQPALFVVEYALARTWMALGVRPGSMIGHSVGELVAACLADVLSLDDALALVAARGRLVQSLPGGAMLGVPLSEERLRELLAGGLSIAAVNGLELCVVSGPEEAVARQEAALAAMGVPARRLRTSHAFHSAAMDPVLPELTELARRLRLRPPRIPYISDVTGTWITEAEATGPEYWARHLRSPVRFADGLRALRGELDPVLLEVGPGETLCTLARRQGTGTAPAVVASLPDRAAGPGEGLEAALGRLWAAGAGVDWALHHSAPRWRVPLPTYPFERQRYWVTPGPAALDGNGAAPPVQPEQHARPEMRTGYVEPRTEVERQVADIWREALGLERVGAEDSFMELGGHSLLATQVTFRLREIFQVDLGLERLFELDTVAGLAGAIEEALIAEVERLSDEDVERLTRAAAAPVTTRGET